MISRADGGCNPAMAEIMQRLVAETEALCRRRWILADTAARRALHRDADRLISAALDQVQRFSLSNNTGCP
jgi:hypothetical protein